MDFTSLIRVEIQENGDESYTAKIRLGGNPGAVHLHVRDTAGEEESSKLRADRLDIMLEAGPPSCLMFDAPNVLNCGTRSALGELRVRATDDYGNKASASFEVRPEAWRHHPTQLLISHHSVLLLRHEMQSELSISVKKPSACGDPNLTQWR